MEKAEQASSAWTSKGTDYVYTAQGTDGKCCEAAGRQRSRTAGQVTATWPEWVVLPGEPARRRK